LQSDVNSKIENAHHMWCHRMNEGH
jgi:hypothetical protein